jgi:dienelactone hydrolase
MARRLLLSCIVVYASLIGWAAQPPAPKVVDLTAPDGTNLKATFFAAGQPGPGVLLLHQCNRQRKMWDELAPKLASVGMNVLTLDFRGFGESGGTPADQLPPGSPVVNEKWPGDVDTAYQFLISQPGVKREVIGAAGASCGVNQSIQLARRHREVKSLVLLSGFTDRDGRRFLKQARQIPVFGSAADDDDGAVVLIEWLLSISPNPANQFEHYKTGGHGMEMFAPHPELAGLVVNWFDTTLIKTPGRAPANQHATFRGTNILEVIDSPGGAAKAKEMLAKAREQDPKADPFPEAIVNQLGYEHMQSGGNKGAIEILQLNVQAFPNSPNAYDSLSDAYLANGQNDLAKQNAQKALSLLANDTSVPEARRKLIQESAEQKLKQLGVEKN